MVEITELELRAIQDTLERVEDEMISVSDQYPVVFNSGAEEGITESKEIVESLLNRIFLDKIKQIEEQYDNSSDDS